MPLTFIRNDITTVPADAIVNAANSGLAPGGGVCGAIFAAAGYDKLERACRAIGHCPTGEAVITKGFRLPARYIIHTVGPVWQGGSRHEPEQLRSCYRNSLLLAEKNGCTSIAFPLISAGIFGYPKGEALRIAVDTIRAFLETHEMEVILVLFDRGAALLSKELLGELQSFIDNHYVETHQFSRTRAEQPYFEAPAMAAPFSMRDTLSSLDDVLSNLDKPFSAALLRLIDEKGMTDVEVYKHANIDRKLFSKLRKPGYTPSKQTVLALAIALRLDLDETADLLRRAGYALSHSSKSDVIFEYFIRKGRYDIYEINQTLFAYDLKPTGS